MEDLKKLRTHWMRKRPQGLETKKEIEGGDSLFRDLYLFLCHLHLFKYLIQGIFIARCERKRRASKWLEVYRNIVETVERSVTFHGIEDAGQDHF